MEKGRFWIARDNDSRLYGYSRQPVLKDGKIKGFGYWHCEDDEKYMFEINQNEYPYIKPNECVEFVVNYN
jgi:hypothetical protein